MSELNKAIIRRSFEDLFTDGNLEVADDVFAPDYIGHDPSLGEDMHAPKTSSSSSACTAAPSPTCS